MKTAVSAPPKAKFAVVGLSCRYPDATNAREFWENTLARRASFRKIQSGRLGPEYIAPGDRNALDQAYGTQAAYMDAIDFDHGAHRISAKSYESTDAVHWLALQVAEEAVADYCSKHGAMGRTELDRTAVIVGNTLTGEDSRSKMQRTRWPYVKKSAEAAGRAHGMSPEAIEALTASMEEVFKGNFPEQTEDSLAGALSNVIAGRICNYLDFHGGGFCVDGACSSGLLAVNSGCQMLAAGQVDLCVAGGVDMSLDVFELIGFSRVGALTTDHMMKVYGAGSTGFIPGEGCGFVALKRLDDAVAAGDQIYAVIDGCGVSSDGAGGITRPKPETQAQAILRAYQHAGHTPADLDFIEGHGTGTTVGDKIELQGITIAIAKGGAATGEHAGGDPACGVTSLKALIGHTKAASGIGGLIKTVIAVNQRVIPPTRGAAIPHEIFATECTGLYPLNEGRQLPRETTLRAGVNSMGFGGINCHIAVSSPPGPPLVQLAPTRPEQVMLGSHQDAELVLLTGVSKSALLAKIEGYLRESADLSASEVWDLATSLLEPQHAEANPEYIVSIVASTGAELTQGLEMAAEFVRTAEVGTSTQSAGHELPFVAASRKIASGCKVGFLFPGQGSQKSNAARWITERFDWAREIVGVFDATLTKHGVAPVSPLLFPLGKVPSAAQLKPTEVSQPMVVLTEVLWAELLRRLGVQPTAVCGHSLGEITALWINGALSRDALFTTVALRSRAFQDAVAAAAGDAGMLCVFADEASTRGWLKSWGKPTAGRAVFVANINGPTETIVAGHTEGLASFAEHLEGKCKTKLLNVAMAFHTELMQPAKQNLDQRLGSARPRLPTATFDAKASTPRVVSTVTGDELKGSINLHKHVVKQVELPVRFTDAIAKLVEATDCVLEVGPGKTLSSLARKNTAISEDCALTVEPRVANAFGPFGRTAAVLLARGLVKPNDWRNVFRAGNRYSRSFLPPSARRFYVNPAEKPQLSLGQREALPGLGAPPLTSESASSQLTSARVDTHDADAEFGFGAETQHESTENDAGSSHGSFPPSYSDAVDAGAKGAPADVPAEPVLDRAELTERVTQVVQETCDSPLVAGYHVDMSLPLEVSSIDSSKMMVLIEQCKFKLDIPPERQVRFSVSQPATNLVIVLVDTMLDSSSSGPATLGGSTLHHNTHMPQWVRSFKIEYVRDDLPSVEPSGMELPPPPSAAKEGAEVMGFGEDLRSCLVVQTMSSDPLARAFKELVQKQDNCTATSTVFTPGQALRNGKTPTDVDAIVVFLTEEDLAGDSREILFPLLIETCQAAQRTAHPRLVCVVPRQGLSISSGVTALPGASFLAGMVLEAPSPTPTSAAWLELPGSSMQGWGSHAEAVYCEVFAHQPRPFASVRFSETLERYLQIHAALPAMPSPPLSSRASTKARGKGKRRSVVVASVAGREVLLFTGGGRGITAAIALAQARQPGVVVVGVNRSPPDHPQIQATIAAAARDPDCHFYYRQCDITNPTAVHALLCDVNAEFGPVTGLVHGAALNRPKRVEHLTVDHARDESVPKVTGISTILAQCDGSGPFPSLQTVVVLSSVIASCGMFNNAVYGASNEIMERVATEYASKHRALFRSLRYSAWSDVGMAVDLGSVDFLKDLGISGISTEYGIESYLRALDGPDEMVVVCGRMGSIETWLTKTTPSTQGLPFVDHVQRFEADVEILVQAEVTMERHPYLEGHKLAGVRAVLPGTFCMEAMAEACVVLSERPSLPTAVTLSNVKFAEAVLPGIIEIHAHQLQATAEAATFECSIVCASSAPIVSTRATICLHYTDQAAHRSKQQLKETKRSAAHLHPVEDLYARGRLFHEAPFRRLKSYVTADFNEKKGKGGTTFMVEFDRIEALFPNRTVAPFVLGDVCGLDGAVQGGFILNLKEKAIPDSIAQLHVACSTLPTEPMTAKAVARLEATSNPAAKSSQGDGFAMNIAVSGPQGDMYQFTGLVMARMQVTATEASCVELTQRKPCGHRDSAVLQSHLDTAAEFFHVCAPKVKVKNHFVPALTGQPRSRRPSKQVAPDNVPNVARHYLRAAREGAKAPCALVATPLVAPSPNTAEWTCERDHECDGSCCFAAVPQLEEAAPALEAAADQTARKALNVDQSATVRFHVVAVYNAAAVVQATVQDVTERTANLLATTAMFTLGPLYAVAVVVAKRPAVTTRDLAIDTPVERQSLTGLARAVDLPSGELGFAVTQPLSLKDFQTPLQHVPCHRFGDWLGAVREAVFAYDRGVEAETMKLIEGGQEGIVTLRSEYTFLKNVLVNGAPLSAVCTASGLTESTITWRVEWRQPTADAADDLVAVTSVCMGWAEFSKDGIQTTPAPWPQFLYAHLRQRAPLALFDDGPKRDAKVIGVAPPMGIMIGTAMRRRFLGAHHFRTTPAHSNLTGTIYFSHFAHWCEQARDEALQKLAPSLFRAAKSATGKTGPEFEVVCLQMDLSHTAELMPFDEVEVQVTLTKLTSMSMRLEFKCLKVVSGGPNTLAAEATQTCACSTSSAADYSFCEWPKELLSMSETERASTRPGRRYTVDL